MLITCLKDTAKNANKTSFFSSSYHGLMVVIGEDNCAMWAGFHTGGGGGGTGIPPQKFERHNCLNSIQYNNKVQHKYRLTVL